MLQEADLYALNQGLPTPGFLGSANGDVGRRLERGREKGQNINSSSSLLLGHFSKDCSPLKKATELVRHHLLQLQLSLVSVKESFRPRWGKLPLLLALDVLLHLSLVGVP